MRFLAGSLIALLLALVIGFGTTLLTLSHGPAFGSFRYGAWTAWPRSGTAGIDPYALAFIARTGQLPIGSGDGLVFFASADDSGRSLDGRCDIVVSGTTPQARYWTLSLYDREGNVVGNTLNRHGFTSQEVVRHADGRFDIVIGPRARAGNWLPSGGVRRYMLVLRLYDSPLNLGSRTNREVALPAIARKECP